MKFIIPEELQKLLAEAPPHPNPHALSLLNLKIGTKARALYEEQLLFTGVVAGSPYKGVNAGTWFLQFEIPCPDHHVEDDFSCTTCGESGAPGIALKTEPLRILGLIPRSDLFGRELFWMYNTCLEHRNPIKRFLYSMFNQHVELDEQTLLKHSPG